MTAHDDRVNHIREKAHANFPARDYTLVEIYRDDLDVDLRAAYMDGATEALTYDDADIARVAKALDETWNPDKTPILSAMFSDYAKTALEAVGMRKAE